MLDANELNNTAISLIKSEYIKNYLITISHQFTYKEQLVIILHSDIELSKKLDILKLYVESSDVADKLNKDDMDELKTLIAEINKVYEYANGIEGYALTYDDKANLYCGFTLETIVNRIRELELEDDQATINIYKLENSEEVGSISIDKTGKIVGYSLSNGIDNTLYDYFLNVPNNIHIGDVISTVYGDEKFVVVNELITPSKFKEGLTYNDSSLVVIPIDVLDSTKDYSKQIEEIYTNRINNIENPCAKPDIIMENYVTVNILDILK